jgi:2-C-methyl-D-erythritol 4-phosphate cytidylyltransferase
MAIPPDKSFSAAIAQTAIILLAAGSSRRMDGKISDKCLFLIRGKFLLCYAYEAFCSVGNWQEIVIIYRDETQKKLLLPHFPPTVSWIPGGSTRAHSVWNALEYLHHRPKPLQWVLIHDGARPYVAKELIESVFCAMMANGNAVPAKEITDTLIYADPLAKNYHYSNRRNYLLLETPQGFSFPILHQAYRQQQPDLTAFTDDSAIYQTQSPIHLVIHRTKNDKITFAEDLPYFEAT